MELNVILSIFQRLHTQGGDNSLRGALKEKQDGESLCLSLQGALWQKGDENPYGWLGRCWQNHNPLQT